jgi:hypothetical protein
VTSSRDVTLSAIERVAEKLGDDLNSVVFVGATAAALYRTAQRIEIRPTDDIDVLLDTKLPQYYELRERLKGRGFKESREPGAPICRMELDGLIVDVMVSDETVLGFSNRWYPEAYRNSVSCQLPSGNRVRVISPIYFLATKLIAFEHRGRGDVLGSKDIEDIVNLLRADLAVLSHQHAVGEVGAFIKARLTDLLAMEVFEDAVFGCYPPDLQSQQRAADFIDRLRTAI